MDKNKRKFFTRRLSYILLRLSKFIHSLFPLWWSYFIGKIFGTLAYFLIRRHRKIAFESLSIAFPNLNKKEIKKIAKNFFVFMAQSSFELIYFLRHTDKISKNVIIEGKEYLDLALSKKKGIILVTAHMGNFPLLGLKLVSLGYPVNFVTRPMRDKNTGDYLYKLRTKANIKTIFSYPRRECLLNIIKALKNNEIVIIQMDQNFGSTGVWVKFFGKLAATPTGPVNLALKTDSSLICGYICRERRYIHKIKLFEEEKLIITEDKDKTILLNVINITRKIESWIKEYPDSWSWIHRRWKSRPSLRIRNLKFKVEK